MENRLHVGKKPLSKMFSGKKPVKRVYCGKTLVWQKQENDSTQCKVNKIEQNI